MESRNDGGPQSSPIHHMTVIRYYRDGRPWDYETVVGPSWSQVEFAIRRMDNYCYPIVNLNCSEFDEEAAIFNVLGGNGRWTLFHEMGEWQYEDSSRGDGEVWLWDSDQGYGCKQKNILTDVEKVLRITKAFYESGSYDHLDEVV